MLVPPPLSGRWAPDYRNSLMALQLGDALVKINRPCRDAQADFSMVQATLYR